MRIRRARPSISLRVTAAAAPHRRSSPASVTTTWRSVLHRVSTRPDRSTSRANATSLSSGKRRTSPPRNGTATESGRYEVEQRSVHTSMSMRSSTTALRAKHCLQGAAILTPCNDDAGTVALRTRGLGVCVVHRATIVPGSGLAPRHWSADRVPGNYVPPMRGDRRPVGTCDRVVVGRLLPPCSKPQCREVELSLLKTGVEESPAGGRRRQRVDVAPRWSRSSSGCVAHDQDRRGRIDGQLLADAADRSETAEAATAHEQQVGRWWTSRRTSTGAPSTLSTVNPSSSSARN